MILFQEWKNGMLDWTFDLQQTKISKITELVSTRYSTIKADITKKFDGMAAFMEQLKSMKSIIDKTVQVGILIESIDLPELNSVTATIHVS